MWTFLLCVSSSYLSWQSRYWSHDMILVCQQSNPQPQSCPGGAAEAAGRRYSSRLWELQRWSPAEPVGPEGCRFQENNHPSDYKKKKRKESKYKSQRQIGDLRVYFSPFTAVKSFPVRIFCQHAASSLRSKSFFSTKVSSMKFNCSILVVSSPLKILSCAGFLLSAFLMVPWFPFTSSLSTSRDVFQFSSNTIQV